MQEAQTELEAISFDQPQSNDNLFLNKCSSTKTGFHNKKKKKKNPPDWSAVE